MGRMITLLGKGMTVMTITMTEPRMRRLERVAEMEKIRKEAEKRHTKSKKEMRKDSQGRVNRTSGGRKTQRKKRQLIDARESK